MSDVSVVLPTYNEAATIGGVLRDLDAAVGQPTVHVVDDGSEDGTPAIAREVGVELGAAVVVHDRDARGLASAICDGLRWADGRYAVVLDADGQHPPERARDLAQEVAMGYTVAVGSRWVDGGGIPNTWPWYRTSLSAIGAGVAKSLVPAADLTTDPMSGFFAVDRQALQAPLDDLDPDGWKALLAILRAADLDRDDVVDVGYQFRERAGGESKMSLRTAVANAAHFARLRAADEEEGSP